MKKKKKKVIPNYGRCVETELSIIPSKNHTDQMIPDVMLVIPGFADEIVLYQE